MPYIALIKHNYGTERNVRSDGVERLEHTKNPDRSNLEMPNAVELRDQWKKSNQELSDHFMRMPVDDWFSRHTAMTDDDFSKEPSVTRQY